MIYKIININENIIENINDSLLQHIAVDYINSSQQYILLEKYGIYNGCEDLVNFIIKKIKSKYNHKEGTYIIEIKNNQLTFNNVFFKILNLHIEFKKNITTNGEYNLNSKFDKDSLLINNVKIQLNLNVLNWEKDIRQILYHELIHAWDDYNSYLQNKGGLLNIIKPSYNNYIKGKLSTDNIKQILSDILYHLDDIEKNSYIAELRGDLESYKETIHGPQEAYNIIKNSVAYKNIMTSKDIIDGLKNNEYNNEIKQKIYSAYKELNNVDWTDNKIMKKLIYQIESYIKKMNKIIPKMCLDFLNNNKIEIKENHRNLIKPLKEYIENKYD